MGRTARHAIVETGLRVDIAHLIRCGWVLPGGCRSGTLSWSNSRTGETTTRIAYVADLRDPANAWMQLSYSVTLADGRTVAVADVVALTTTVPTYGGLRWWFVCPITGQNCRCIHLPPGAEHFASRRAHRLRYQSQRLDDLGAAQARERRIIGQLGGAYERPLEPLPDRPKWMRRRTYNRLAAELDDAQADQDNAFIDATERLLARRR